MSYSIGEAYDMLAVYFQCFENPCIAARVYAANYPDRRHFSRKVFMRLARNLRESGQVHPIPVPTRNRTIRNEDNIINVLAYIQINPHLSTRRISLDLDISKSTVHRILLDHSLHPYHVVLHQALSGRDFDSRLDYCYWLRFMIAGEPYFLSRILWTDEASFTSTGGVNLHNMHYWSSVNPHWIREVDYQNRWSVNVWCGILNGQIIGPFIFNGHLNGAVYLNFLANQLPALLEDDPLQIRRDMWFQHDGCPAHFSLEVHNFLNENYPNRWIGRGSLFPWPARSPDLTVLDFYLWRRIKGIVFETGPTTPENMIERIRNAIGGISRTEIEVAVSSNRHRLDRCIENDGKHSEHL